MSTNIDIRPIADGVAVAEQIAPGDVAGLAAAGFRAIVNNRPDGEAPDQPRSEAIEAEARRHGLLYRHIPIVPGEANEADARAMAAAIAAADGPVLAFCRTGNRSAALWRLAQGGS